MNLIKYLTPINLLEEKEKFFKSNKYNPRFQYDWNSGKTKLWAKKQTRYKDLITALDSQEAKLIQKEALVVFQTKLDDKLLNFAKKIVATHPDKINNQSISMVESEFEKAFHLLGLTDYKLNVVDKHGFNFRPSYKAKQIIVSKHLNLDYFSVDGEVKHELTHIIRYENGKFNNIKRSDNYLPTEEGLATYMQDYTGKLGKTSLFQHAAEYVVTSIALKGSLREMVEHLVSLGFTKELAFQRAVRHKFGFIDTSKPGDIMKPSMYFFNQQKIARLNTDKIYRLLVGKISINEIKYYPYYSGIVSLEKLKYFYKLQNES